MYVFRREERKAIITRWLQDRGCKEEEIKRFLGQIQEKKKAERKLGNIVGKD